MGTVSANLSPVTLSCVDNADLAQKPIGSLLTGDLAFVESHEATPEGPYFFLNLGSAATVDGVSVLSTSAPQGRWLSLAYYGGVPAGMTTFSTVADLAAFDDAAVPDGGSAYVASLRAGWSKVVESPAPAGDGISVVATASGDGGWYRSSESPSWGLEASFYLDPVAGDDENTGLLQADPIATWAELARRLSGAKAAVVMSVWLLDDSASTTDYPKFVNLPPKSSISIEGSLGTTSAVGGTVVAPVNGYTGAASMAANQHFEMGTSVAAAGLVGKLLRLANGALAYGVYAVGANTLRTTPFINPTTAATVTPVAADVFTIETPPTISAPPIAMAIDKESYVQFRQVWFVNHSGNLAIGTGFGGYVGFIACRFADGYWDFVSGYPSLTGCLVYGANPLFVELDIWDNCECSLIKSACLSDWSRLWVYANGTLRLLEQTLLQSGANVSAQPRSHLRVSDLAVFNNTTGQPVLKLFDFCTLEIYAYNTSYLYGTSAGNVSANSQVLSLGGNCHVTYASLAQLVATVNGAQPLIFRGYAAQAWAATIKTAAAADSQSTFTLSV